MRTFFIYSMLVLVLGGLAGFAWLTHHPETPWIADAEHWAIVGPAARWFRDTYLPPESRGRGGGREVARSTETGAAGEEPEILVLGASRHHASEQGVPSTMIWLEPGMEILRDPSPNAPFIHRLKGIANVPQLERQGDWVRVRYRGISGWVRSPRARRPSSPPTPEPVLPVLSLAPDEARLARAVELLGIARFPQGAGLPGSPSAKLGPYPLYTDHADAGLRAYLGRVASGVRSAYERRYGRQPIGEPAEAILLFRREEDYRAYLAFDHRLSGLRSSGHAGGGLLALYVGEEHREEVASTLIHEIVHLLNRRALGPALPPWLDEGLAGDLGAAVITTRGELRPGELGGRIEQSSEQPMAGRFVQRIDYHGSRAALRRLRQVREEGTGQPLAVMVSLPWEDFVDPARSELNYAQSAFFLRYLLEAENGALAAPFRAFLEAVSRGEAATGEALRARLGRSWSELEQGLGAWLHLQDQLQQPVGAGS